MVEPTTVGLPEVDATRPQRRFHTIDPAGGAARTGLKTMSA